MIRLSNLSMSIIVIFDYYKNKTKQLAGQLILNNVKTILPLRLVCYRICLFIPVLLLSIKK